MLRGLVKWLERRLRERWFIRLLTLIWLAIWLYALCTAALTTVSGNDSSGWWQVVIEFFGFPALLYALFELWKRIAEGQWKPEIRIGIVPVGRLRSEIREMDPLPTSINADASEGQATFSLVIRNQGKLAARSVKIEVEHPLFDENHAVLNSQQFRFDPSMKNYECPVSNDQSVVIHAGDEKAFSFLVHAMGHPGHSLALPLRIDFQCKVWADGLDSPPEEEVLTLRLEAPETLD